MPIGVAVVADALLGGQARARRARGRLGPRRRRRRSTPTKLLGASTAALARTGRRRWPRRQATSTTALAGGEDAVEAEYEVPYLAHAPMEPLNCTVKIDGDRCEIWTGTQFQTVDQARGGGDRRARSPSRSRSTRRSSAAASAGAPTRRRDFVAEAVQVAKAAGVPVKVVWTREDDMRGGYYRPMCVHRVAVGARRRGRRRRRGDHAIVGQSIIAGTPFERSMVKDGIDETSVEGVADSPYLDGDRRHRVVAAHAEAAGPGPVVALGRPHAHRVRDGDIVDELAPRRRAGSARVPAARCSQGTPRHRRRARARGRARPAGARRRRRAARAALAVHESFESYVAQVAEVSVENGRIRVHRGRRRGRLRHPRSTRRRRGPDRGRDRLRPDGGALRRDHAARTAASQQSNFHDYPVLRMNEMPKVEVHIVASTREDRAASASPATPPIAPAVANAVFALTGKRLRVAPLPADLDHEPSTALILSAPGPPRCSLRCSPPRAACPPRPARRLPALAPARPAGRVRDRARACSQHPRCQNCHPGRRRAAAGRRRPGPPPERAARPDGHGRLGAECATCHGPGEPPDSYGAAQPRRGARRWRMPQPDEKTGLRRALARRRCAQQIKDPARNGGKDMAALAQHVDSDRSCSGAGTRASAARRSRCRTPSSSRRSSPGWTPAALPRGRPEDRIGPRVRSLTLSRRFPVGSAT